MKTSINWLKQYVDLPWSPSELADRLTMAGLEVEEIEELGTDTVIDWEVTPNRPDWLSHVGIARETAALTGGTLTLPDAGLPEGSAPSISEQVDVSVQAPDLCPRYTARLIRNVTVGPSPDWMQAALEAVGLRPINNIVDITNYVLLECGQPLHAFDLARLAGPAIVVRRADEGESITTLDGATTKLGTNHLVIADAEKAVALAGIMGGANSEISEGTTDVLLESAAFNASNVRATSKKLEIATDSSYRFERGVDINMVEFASARAAKLIIELAGGELAADLADCRAATEPAADIHCRYARVSERIGVDLSPDEITRPLEALGLKIVSNDDESCMVGIPSYRLDLEREVDLIEEVARLYGVDNIPASEHVQITGVGRDRDTWYPIQQLHEELIGLGLDECLNLSLVSAREATDHTGFAEEDLVTLLNPLTSDAAALRPSLLPGMLRTVHNNAAHDIHDLRLYEIGRVFSAKSEDQEEHLEACLVMTGRRHPERFSAEREQTIDYYDLKGVVEDWLDTRRAGQTVFTACAHPACSDGVAAAISLDGTDIGVIGRVRDELTKGMRLKMPVFAAMIDLDAMLSCAQEDKTYSPMPAYPAVNRDVAFIAEEHLAHRDVVDAIRGNDLDILENVELFDLYRDVAAIGAGKKSMAYSLTFRSRDRTLTDEEVNDAHDRIKAALKAALPIEIRE